MYIFLRILHLSSNRKAQNSAHPFQFETSDRELTLQPTEKCKIRAVLHQKVTNFADQEIIWDLRPENLQKPAQKYMNFDLNALIDPKLYIP